MSSRDDYGAISVISDEEREALGLGGRGRRRKPDEEEEEGLFETIGKAGDKLGETKLGQKIGSILTVLILAFFGSGSVDMDILDNIFGGEEDPVLKGGCTEPTAINFKPDADFDNGSCAFPPPVIYGCMDANALNYNSQATHSNNQCSYPPNQNGTNNNTATNETVYGCMDIDANNFNDRATEDDGSCDYENESNHCNHTELIVWDGLEYEAVLYRNDGENGSVVSFGRDSESSLELYIDMDTDCNDHVDQLPVMMYYDIGHLIPQFDDNDTFMYYGYDNMSYGQYQYNVSGWEEDEHVMPSNAEPYEETFNNMYDGVYFFYASLYVDWNGTGEYEYHGYMTNYPQTWVEDWEYSEEYGIKLEEDV